MMYGNKLFDDATIARQKVCDTFNKKEAEVNEDVRSLRRWMETQPHLPEIMPKTHIQNFLFLNKFSIEKTKQKIDMYYTIRNLIPDFYDCSNPKSPQMAELLENINYCVHPKMLQDLYRVYMFKVKKPNTLLFKEAILILCNIAEIRLHEDCFFYDVHVLDLSNLTFNDVSRITPTIIVKGLAIYEKVYSFRFKNIYFINAPTYISTVMTILKSVLKPKLFERIHVYGNDEILKELFTIDILPRDYGGYGPSLDELTDIIKEKFDEYQNRFDQLDKLRVDESSRPEKLENDDILGFHGNFKKLNVD